MARSPRLDKRLAVGAFTAALAAGVIAAPFDSPDRTASEDPTAPGTPAKAFEERLNRSGFSRLPDFQGLQAWYASRDGADRLVLARIDEGRLGGVVEDLFFSSAEDAANLFLAATSELPETPATHKHLMQYCATGKVRESVGLQTGPSMRIELNHALTPAIELTAATEGGVDTLALQATQWQSAAIGEEGKTVKLPQRLIERLGNTVKPLPDAAACPEQSGAFPAGTLPLPGISEQEFRAHGEGDKAQPTILWLDDSKQHGLDFEPTWQGGRLLRWEGKAVAEEDAVPDWAAVLKTLEAELGPPTEVQYTQEASAIRTVKRWWFDGGVSLELAITRQGQGDSMAVALTAQVN